MKKKNAAMTIGSLSVISAVLFTSLVLSPADVLANSAQRKWSGTEGSGVISGEECPLIVENEVLTFDIDEFPKIYYHSLDEFLEYSGKVTAEYIFYNPADYEVTAVLVFPFGKMPDYAYTYDDIETGDAHYNADTEKFQVTVDGNPVEKTLRHTYGSSEFDPEADLQKLCDESAEDDFYAPDLTVRKYTYRLSGIDEEKYPAASAGFTVSGNGEKTKVYMEQASGYNMSGKDAEISAWASNGEQLEIYLIGAAPEKLPRWYFCEDGGMEKQISGNAELIDETEMSFLDFTMMSFDPDSGISRTDWYNAVVNELNLNELEAGFIESRGDRLDVSDSLLRWYEYEVTVGPGEQVVNTVAAPLYPAVDNGRDPEYEYTYFLSPARTWKEFHDLEVVIHTPYLLRESSLDGFEAQEEGYVLRFDSLPTSELEFTLAETAETGLPGWIVPAAVLLLSAAGAGAVICIVRNKRRQRRK